MFRFAENSRCRENEIPAFAGMERGVDGEIKRIPIPAKAGISPTSNCFGVRCWKTIRESGRFPLSREWKEGTGMGGGGGNEKGGREWKGRRERRIYATILGEDDIEQKGKAAG